MKAIAALVLFSVLASPALAECHRYTLDGQEPGQVVADIADDRVLTLADKSAGTVVYDLISAGTGIAFMEGVPQTGGDRVEVLEHKGDLIIDMAVYTPYCRP